MGKEQRRLLITTTFVVFILLVLTLLYASLFTSDVKIPVVLRNHWFSNSEASFGGKKVDKGINKVQLKFLLRRLVRGEERIQLETTGFSCHSDANSEYCLTNKPIRFDTDASTIYIPSSQVRKSVIPYANKDAIQYVSPVQLTNEYSINLPVCNFTHKVPAVVFSTKGFAGNLFHEFSDTIIPLFITSRHFQTRLKFVITDYQQWWVDKYSKILSSLSSYDVIPAENATVHCFPGAVIGLKSHGFLALNSTDIPGGYSMFDFRQFIFIRKIYNLKIKCISEIKREKPILMLISRTNSRMFTNEDEMVVLMEELGFEVFVTRPKVMSDLEKFSGIVNSCSVMVGAHGAGLTNSVFLPAGAVMVQVVPIGIEWASTNYFGEPVKNMGVKYLEYMIEPEESSLLETHSRDDPVFTDPATVFSKGYYAARAVYIDGQNLKINLQRFRETLVKARELIGQ